MTDNQNLEEYLRQHVQQLEAQVAKLAQAEQETVESVNSILGDMGMQVVLGVLPSAQPTRASQSVTDELTAKQKPTRASKAATPVTQPTPASQRVTDETDANQKSAKASQSADRTPKSDLKFNDLFGDVGDASNVPLSVPVAPASGNGDGQRQPQPIVAGGDAPEEDDIWAQFAEGGDESALGGGSPF